MGLSTVKSSFILKVGERFDNGQTSNQFRTINRILVEGIIESFKGSSRLEWDKKKISGDSIENPSTVRGVIWGLPFNFYQWTDGEIYWKKQEKKNLGIQFLKIALDKVRGFWSKSHHHCIWTHLSGSLKHYLESISIHHAMCPLFNSTMGINGFHGIDKQSGRGRA